MSIGGIESIGSSLFTSGLSSVNDASSFASTSGASSVQGPQGPNFSDMLLGGIQRLEGMQDKTDQLSVKAATGDLNAIHDYTIAATETQVATQLTVAVRNKAVEAFNDIMRMQV
jgi:flagellar hook-basal body complex protein FliE